MPTAAPRVCPRCRRTIPPGRCPDCDKSWSRRPKSWTGGQSSHSRWRRLRARKLAADPLCQLRHAGCTQIAAEVHHTRLDDDRDRYDWALLRSTCTSCHKRETQQQSRTALHGKP